MGMEQILQPNSDATQLVCTAEIEHAYPPTKIMWSPRLESELTEYLATSADFLRLWSFTGTSVKYVATIAAVRSRQPLWLSASYLGLRM